MAKQLHHKPSPIPNIASTPPQQYHTHTNAPLVEIKLEPLLAPSWTRYWPPPQTPWPLAFTQPLPIVYHRAPPKSWTPTACTLLIYSNQPKTETPKPFQIKESKKKKKTETSLLLLLPLPLTHHEPHCQTPEVNLKLETPESKSTKKPQILLASLPPELLFFNVFLALRHHPS